MLTEEMRGAHAHRPVERLLLFAQVCALPRLAAVDRDVNADDAAAATTPRVPLERHLSQGPRLVVGSTPNRNSPDCAGKTDLIIVVKCSSWARLADGALDRVLLDRDRFAVIHGIPVN